MSKDRLVNLHKTGRYATIPARELFQFYEMSKSYIELNSVKKSAPLEEYYNLVELHFFLSLQTNHDVEAKTMLDILCDQFEVTKSERLVILRSIFIEATTNDPSKAAEYLSESAQMMAPGRGEDLIQITKRNIACRSNDKEKYIEHLVKYLDINPLDASVWCELGNVYLALSNFEKTIFCFQEILLVEPSAYNIWCRIGETFYQWAQGSKGDSLHDRMNNSKKHFLRATELSSNSVRAWCGVYMSTKTSRKKDAEVNGKLNRMAFEKLQQIKDKKLCDSETLHIIDKLFTQ